jgi:HEAT repeat protein
VWSDAAVEPLVQALGDAHPAVRAAAAAALAETWSETAGEALRLTMSGDPSAQVRERALTALGRLGDDEVREQLAIAVQDPSPRVRRAAREIREALAPARPE